MRFVPDKCPKCGEPPRSMRVLLLCAVPLEQDEEDFEPRFHRLRYSTPKEERLDPDIVSTATTLECGGGHRWEAEVMKL